MSITGPIYDIKYLGKEIFQRSAIFKLKTLIILMDINRLINRCIRYTLHVYKECKIFTFQAYTCSLYDYIEVGISE